jgi:hypothetical protein
MSREATAEDELPPDGEMPSELEEILGEETPLRLSIPDVPDATKPLMPFTGILGVTLEQLGLPDNAKTMGRNNLMKFVQVMTKPVGLINLTNNTDTKVQFARPFTGSFDSVTIFVFLPDQIGLLIQEEGDPTIKISLLPEQLQELYMEAPVVQLKRRPITGRPVEEEIKPPIIIGQNPIMAKTRRRPLVANVPRAPLIEVAQEEKKEEQVVKPVIRKRPVVVQPPQEPQQPQPLNSKPKNVTRRRPRVVNTF